MITYRGIKSGPVAFVGFLNLKPYFTIETTTQDKKKRVRHLLVRVKARRRVLMMGKACRRVKRVSMMGKARRGEARKARN